MFDDVSGDEKVRALIRNAVECLRVDLFAARNRPGAEEFRQANFITDVTVDRFRAPAPISRPRPARKRYAISWRALCTFASSDGSRGLRFAPGENEQSIRGGSLRQKFACAGEGFADLRRVTAGPACVLRTATALSRDDRCDLLDHGTGLEFVR